jgi:hypothetical protein
MLCFNFYIDVVAGNMTPEDCKKQKQKRFHAALSVLINTSLKVKVLEKQKFS